MISLKHSVNGLISVIIFKRTITNISFNITNLKGDNYLGTNVRVSKIMTSMPMAVVLNIYAPCVFFLEQVTGPSMYNIASAVTCRLLAIVRSLPFPKQTIVND